MRYEGWGNWCMKALQMYGIITFVLFHSTLPFWNVDFSISYVRTILKIIAVFFRLQLKLKLLRLPNPDDRKPIQTLWVFYSIIVFVVACLCMCFYSLTYVYMYVFILNLYGCGLTVRSCNHLRFGMGSFQASFFQFHWPIITLVREQSKIPAFSTTALKYYCQAIKISPLLIMF